MRRPSTDTKETEQQQWSEQVIAVDRVARVVKGGRRFRFRALVAVGDRKCQVGIGIAKGSDVQMAVTKAIAVAKRSLITVPIQKGTIPHRISQKHGGANVLLMPAAPGTGIIAGGVVRTILEATSLKNIMSKSLGSNNKINTSYATINALAALVPREQWQSKNNTKSKQTTKREEKKTTPRRQSVPAKPKAAKRKSQ